MPYASRRVGDAWAVRSSSTASSVTHLGVEGQPVVQDSGGGVIRRDDRQGCTPLVSPYGSREGQGRVSQPACTLMGRTTSKLPEVLNQRG